MKILKKIIKTGLISILTLSAVLLFTLPVMAGEKLEKMDDLPSLKSNDSGLLRAQSTQDQTQDTVENDIVILYKDDGQNNVGNLNLQKSDFEAGSTLNEQVDVLRVKDSDKVDNIIDEIKDNESVLAVDRDAVARILDVPNDKHYEQYQTYLAQVGYENSWNIASKNPVKVAVLDTGIRADHEDLKNRIDNSGKNYTDEEFTDTEGHGTGVASVLCAQTNNSVGIAGASGISDVKVVDYKIGDSNGESSVSTMVAAFTDISKRKDIKVINLSMGLPERNNSLVEACKLVEANGTVVVSSSGNSNEAVYYPAAVDSVIATGAINADYERCTPEDWGEGYGSCFGPEMKLVAPGNEIAVASPEKTSLYTLNSGTSFSSPIVAGAAAVLYGQNPDLTPAQVKEILYSTAQDLGKEGKDNDFGYGVVRIDKALDKLNQLPDVKVVIDNPDLTVLSGKIGQIEAHSTNGGALIYKTSDASVARVDSNGVVTPGVKGTCVITVSLVSEPAISADCKVTVVSDYQKVTRLYNKISGEHLYTTSSNEAASLSSQPDWDNEGVKWESPESGKPVYRLYSLITHNHLYTSDNNEVKSLLNSEAWTIDNEGEPVFYSGGDKNIYRLYNEELKMHLLTIDEEEYNTLPDHGWTQEDAKFKCY